MSLSSDFGSTRSLPSPPGLILFFRESRSTDATWTAFERLLRSPLFLGEGSGQYKTRPFFGGGGFFVVDTRIGPWYATDQSAFHQLLPTVPTDWTDQLWSLFLRRGGENSQGLVRSVVTPVPMGAGFLGFL